MATALLIGTNAWAATSVNSWDALKTALEAGGEVTLSSDIDVVYDASTFKSILIGAKNSDGTALAVDGTAPAAAVLDLAGHNITITANSYVAINPFVLTKGSLKVTGTGTIEVTGSLTHSTNVFFVFGADDANKVNPKVAPFSKLEIDKNVMVKTNNGTVIAIDQLTKSHAALTKTDFAKKGYATTKKAYGVFVDVKGTLISEGATYKTKKCYGIKVNGNVTVPDDDADKIYAPYVYVEPSAVIRSDMRSDLAGSTAIYASGFGQWLIEGNCSGATGVYISSGIVAINDATVKSAADTYVAAGSGTHANGSGSAIVINSRDTRSGEVEVTVSGDTKAESTSGYALEEIVNTKEGDTKVETIAIEGGSFEGGEKGALVVTTSTVENADVTVAGGNVTGSAELGSEDLATYLNEQGGTHATLVEDENGKTILVISEGSAPVGYATIAAALAAGKTSVKLTGASDAISGNVVLGELEINEATAQVLTIPANASLTVGRVVLGKYAQIIVEAGGKFIVTGEQGIVAPVAENIVLKTSESAQAIFLFNPAVTSNKHPNATVEFASKSYMKNGINVFQRFGIPTYTNLESMTSSNPAIRTRIWEYSAAADSWKELGDLGSFDIAQLNKPFAGYNSIAYTETANMVYTMKGALVGNQDAQLDATLNWTTFANSYTANIEITEFLSALTGNMDATVYAYKVTNPITQEYTWDAVNEISLLFDPAVKIAPMQAFILHKIGQENGQSVINYNDAVYQPAVSGASLAPRRALANLDITKIGMTIANEQGAYDKLYFVESDDFTADYERGFDAEKYMNEDINVYAHAAEKQATLATNDLENTYVGFSTTKGGKFTISFANVEGREFELIDHATGARVAIAEGNTYEFTAEANSTNDYRFEIVSAAKMPTAIENAEAVKSAKGIYTITGQYVGEMNVWNTLPAGIYVVNGEKLVK